jgi:competence protein ComEC
VGAYYAAWTAAWWLWRQPNQSGARQARTWPRRGIALCAVAAAVAVARPPMLAAATPADGQLHVTFIDVGQGDAALVRFPHGNTMLVDAGGLPGGGGFDVGDRVVAPVLRASGVHRLTMLALSHGDADHAGGAEAVLREFRPPLVWEGVPVPRLPVTTRLRAAALDTGTLWTNLQTGDHTTVDGVDVRVLHPPLPGWERQSTRNDDSVVLELRWSGVSFVFPGDLGRDGEAQVVPLLEPAPIRVLKVPHHGSQTSSSPAFLAALRPDAAVVSVGRSNTFGHPSRSVVARYEGAGIALFRTDLSGAVFMDSDGHSVDVRTWTGAHLRVEPRAAPRAPP